jgi:hypothetical protein
MTWEIPDGLYSLPAAADLSTKQYRFLAGSLEDGVNVASTGTKVLGVQYSKPFGVIGEAITIASDGIVKVVCDSTVTDGGVVKVGASGGAADATSGTQGVGIALEDGQTDQIISVQLKDFGVMA